MLPYLGTILYMKKLKRPKKMEGQDSILWRPCISLRVVWDGGLDCGESGLEEKIYIIRQITPTEDLVIWIQIGMHTTSRLA